MHRTAIPVSTAFSSEFVMSHVAILIDGSNFIGCLYRADTGYPALGPLIAELCAGDRLSYARFYGAPPPREPWKGRWQAFVAANRHVDGLDFFQGYRHARSGEEKAIDVALVTDLLYGKIANHFDRAVVVCGDGDHIYALKVARTVLNLGVLLVGAGQSGFAQARIPFTVLDPARLVACGVCARGAGSPVPAGHRAPPNAPRTTPILRGSNAAPS